MKPKGKDENRLGPVNPFTVGNVFIEAAKKMEWIEEEKTDRHRQFFITSKGFEEMNKLGMDLQKALMYRQPPEEPQPRHVQQPRHSQQPQQQHRATAHPRHRSRDHRRH